MLSDHFIDWWFAPWRYAAASPAGLAPAPDLLAQRDQYGLWCAQAGVRPDVPSRFDPGWQVAAVGAAPQLRKGAELFGGVIAARGQDQAALGRLVLAERRWCMSIALTQPLKGCCERQFDPRDPVELQGLTELARRLERGFPGLWPRLRLQLPAALAGQVHALLPAALADPVPAAASEARVQRCWQMCLAHAASLSTT